MSVISRFSGAHHLRGYDGPCGKVHGHNWEVEVFVRGSGLDQLGMLADFTAIKSSMREVLARLDHEDLNIVAAFESRNPTSENLARHLHERLSGILDCPSYRVFKVRVSESPGSSASYWKSDGA